MPFAPFSYFRHTGIPLRKGDAVLMVYRELHLNPEYWGPRPRMSMASHSRLMFAPDEFQPELHSPEATEARPAHTYLPFGLGPKGCPGTVGYQYCYVC